MVGLWLYREKKTELDNWEIEIDKQSSGVKYALMRFVLLAI
jgi:hypothetical protein